MRMKSAVDFSLGAKFILVLERGERMKRITKIAENASLGKKKIRVAAYCRVKKSFLLYK